MGIQVCVKLSVAAAALLLGWSAAHAVLLEQWTNRAMDFVAKFEGSDFGAITPDVDCQGLSLGKKQHTIKGNSVRNVFEEVIALVGRPGLDQIITDTLGDKAADLSLLVDKSLNNSEARMARVRSWQEIKQGGRWVDLTEGECATGAKRSISPTSQRLKAPYGERIAAFLQHATVTQAQSTLISRGGKMALERAACWGDFRLRSVNPIAVEQLQVFVQPLPTPPRPAEALSFPSPQHMASNLLFHPVLNEAEALTGVSDRKVIHPTAQHRVDQMDHPIHWLRSVAAEHILELPQQCRSFLELRRVIRTPFTPLTTDAAEIESEEAEALATTEVHDSTLVFIDLDL